MTKAISVKMIPDGSIISKDFGKISYFDSYKITLNTNDNVDSILSKAFTGPKWADYLMKIRNSIVGVFGLKTGDSKDARYADYYPIGSKAVIFTVSDRNDSEIVMSENDKHLYFRTSVYLKRDGESTDVYLTTLVRFNNLFGNLYFTPVKPFHKMIIKSSLNRLL